VILHRLRLPDGFRLRLAGQAQQRRPGAVVGGDKDPAVRHRWVCDVEVVARLPGITATGACRRPARRSRPAVPGEENDLRGPPTVTAMGVACPGGSSSASKRHGRLWCRALPATCPGVPPGFTKKRDRRGTSGEPQVAVRWASPAGKLQQVLLPDFFTGLGIKAMHSPVEPIV